MPVRRFAGLIVCLLPLAGCDQLGIESAQSIAARKEAEGRAIGSACRHAARALEDCFALNRKADKAAIFAGWREMNDYMRDNKIEPVTPQLGPATADAGTQAGSRAAHDPAGEGAADGEAAERPPAGSAPHAKKS